MFRADGLELLFLIAIAPSLLAFLDRLLERWMSGRTARADRRRNRFAEALAAVVLYAELPFVIRRRRAGSPEDERIRISTEARHVQERIAFHAAWLHAESPAVAASYNELVDKARCVVGDQMRRAWKMDPVASDAEMNIDDVDLSAVDPLKEAYLEAVRKHLSGWRR